MPVLPLKAIRKMKDEAESRRERVYRSTSLDASEDTTPTESVVSNKSLSADVSEPHVTPRMVANSLSLMSPATGGLNSQTPHHRPWSAVQLAPSEAKQQRRLHLPEQHDSRTPLNSLQTHSQLQHQFRPPQQHLQSQTLMAPGAHHFNHTFVVRTPVRPRVTFARSPDNKSTEITPYSHVYGVHPAFFDFDRHGAMQPTEAGMAELSRGGLHCLTPSVRGRMAFVIQGASPNDSAGRPSPQHATPVQTGSRFWVGQSPATTPHSRVSTPGSCEHQYVAGEDVLVLTDDGKAWMDAKVVAVYPWDCEAEGYSIPGGTVKVSYELGIKWVMPQNLKTTLRPVSTKPAFPAFNPAPRQSVSQSPHQHHHHHSHHFSQQQRQAASMSPAIHRAAPSLGQVMYK
mmetsp:Transcript_23259/g.51048  ORF Transcript_23259/g.51048 Transcript_23259/m.51048 type:complete len:399 (+) Transcript_23259:84-1280(+)